MNDEVTVLPIRMVNLKQGGAAREEELDLNRKLLTVSSRIQPVFGACPTRYFGASVISGR
jgi:hypothetical protein